MILGIRNFYLEFLFIPFGLSLIISLPSFKLFFNYLNQGTRNAKIKNGEYLVFPDRIEKIVNSEIVFGDVNNVNGSGLNWVHFFYVEISTEQEKYFLTCLSHSVKEFYFVEKHKIDTFPLIRKEKEPSIDINRFVNKFQTKSDADLVNITNSKDRYSENAVEAAKQILKQRKGR
jgi:hypothetical protein